MNDPLRILHFCPRPSFSGLESYALSVGRGQKSLGHEIEFAVLAGSPLASQCAAAGIASRIVPGGRDLTLRIKHFLFFLIEMALYLTSPGRPDIVHLHSTQDLDTMLMPFIATRLHFCFWNIVERLWPRSMADTSLAILLRKRAGRRPKIILQTHIWISHTKRDPLHFLSYLFIDEIWCSSEPARRTLEKYLPVQARKIEVIKYGREIEKMESSFLSREEARQKLGLPAQATVVASVARIDEGKGTHELLEGSLLTMQTNPDLHLILIGPPTADDPKAVAFGKRIRERIARLEPPYRGRVHAPGAVANSYQYLKAFDLFALPTYRECFALSLLEAQLAGLPCLATDSGGSPEVVLDGETGWLFEPRSIELLRGALERALRERDKWSLFGANARDRVRREFDFARILPLTIEKYRELMRK